MGISYSSVYYKLADAPAERLRLMRRIDELHLELPFAGARMLRDLLKAKGFKIGQLHVSTLMRRMGIEAICRRKNTSRPHPDHIVFRYLLRNLPIDRPNQVWAADLTYIPRARGFVYLGRRHRLAHCHKVLAWRLSNSMTADFCVEILDEVLRKFGRPEIFNTDQGAQFTCSAFINVRCSISMDGRADG